MEGNIDLGIDLKIGKPDKVLVNDLQQRYRSTFRTADRQDMAALFAKIDTGRPVMALIQVGVNVVNLHSELAALLTGGLSIIGPKELRYPQLHWIVVKGYDDQNIYWYDTNNNEQHSWSHADFYTHWNLALIAYDDIVRSFFENNVSLYPRTMMWIDEPMPLTLTPFAGPGGSISPANQQVVLFGSNASFSITPNACYHTADVLIDSVSKGTLSNYTFSNVKDNHSIRSFFSNQYTLTASKAGTGHGTVISSPAGINCGVSSPSCGNVFPQDCSVSPSIVTLTASPDADSSFAGWSNGCSGMGNCIITMTDDKVATATFNILPPIAGFSASSTTGSVPLFGVQFTDQSRRPWTAWADTYTWDFGDGAISHEQNPRHVYAAEGTYAVTLTVKNPSGTNTTQPMSITVLPCADQPVRINRGNGATLIPYSTLQAAYNVAMDHDVIETLAINFVENIDINRPMAISINGGFGCGYTQLVGSSTIQGQVTASDGTITLGNIEIVTGTPTGGSSDPIYDIVVNAGVGGSITPAGTTIISKGKSQSYSITPAQGYYIQDVLVDGVSVGAVNTYTFANVTTNHRIEVTFTGNIPAVPIAGLSGMPTTGIVSLTVDFTDLSTESPNQWLWNFGDGTTSTIRNPVHTYAAAGTYSVSLTATNSAGSNTATRSNYVVVFAIPPPVKIVGAVPEYYSSIQAAYDAASNGTVIQVRDLTFTENLNFNRNITISLEGGYNSDYSSGTGLTMLQGAITINAGTITIKNFNLLQ
ncbi:MAG: PKD domain-containing protein [Nitrospirota bacterium]